MCLILIARQCQRVLTIASALASSGRVLADLSQFLTVNRGVIPRLNFLVVGLRIELRTCTLWGYRSKPTELQPL